MSDEQLKLTLEAAMMAAAEPLTLKRLRQLFADDMHQPDDEKINSALAELVEDYQLRSVALVEVASGFCFQVKKVYAPWIIKLWDVKPPRYSRPLLETLALIAYKQPITRSEIEDVRGVSVSSYIIKTLMDREWIKVIGHRDVPGKPALLATTRGFLDHFNLKRLDELPSLPDIRDSDKAGAQMEFEGIMNGSAQFVTVKVGTGVETDAGNTEMKVPAEEKPVTDKLDANAVDVHTSANELKEA